MIIFGYDTNTQINLNPPIIVGNCLFKFDKYNFRPEIFSKSALCAIGGGGGGAASAEYPNDLENLKGGVEVEVENFWAGI